MPNCFPLRSFAQLSEHIKRAASATAVAATLFCALPATAETIKDIEQRGFMKCGVLNDYPGFGFLDSQGNYQGFDVDFCRAIAAAIKTDVRYTQLDGNTPLSCLGLQRSRCRAHAGHRHHGARERPQARLPRHEFL